MRTRLLGACTVVVAAASLCGACGLVLGIEDHGVATPDAASDAAAVDAAEAAGDAPVGADVTTGGCAGAHFIGSRTTTFTGNSISVAAPADVTAGDLLIAAWVADDLVSPADWTELASGTAATGGGTVRSVWVGYHVLTTAETDATTWTFGGNFGMTVEVLAFHGQRAVQPVAPAKANSAAPTCDGTTNALDGISITTSGCSIPLFVFAITTVTPNLPNIPGTTQELMSGGLAFYRAPAAVADGTSVPGPRVDAPGKDGCTDGGLHSGYFTASLAVVAP